MISERVKWYLLVGAVILVVLVTLVAIVSGWLFAFDLADSQATLDLGQSRAVTVGG